MTPEQQRIAIAEACGTLRMFYCPHCRETVKEGNRRKVGSKWLCNYCATGELYQDSPNYLNDLNAMHEAEKTLNGTTVDIRSLYYDYLALTVPQWPKNRDETFEHEYSMVTATAAQRAEAFLRTMGKWK